MLLNFFSIFEITINEFRKKDIAMGLFDFNKLSSQGKMESSDAMLLQNLSQTQEYLKRF
jgi:hypothetical protein